MKDCIPLIKDGGYPNITKSIDKFLGTWWKVRNSCSLPGVYYAALKETTKPYRTIAAIYQYEIDIKADEIIAEFSTEFEPQPKSCTKCPPYIVNMLSGTKSKTALNWRNACYVNAKR